MSDWERPADDAPATERLDPRPAPTTGSRRRGPSPVLVLSAAVLALALVGVWYFFLSGRDGSPAQVAASPSASATASETQTVATPETTTVQAGETYTVAEGDTLGAIAQRFGTTVDALVEANGITDPNLVTLGTELVIPAASPSPPR